MKIVGILREKLSGLYEALSRYPLTVAFLIVAAIVNSLAISWNMDYEMYFLTFVVGACLGFTLQGLWERFFYKNSVRMVLMGVALVLTLGYFLIVRQNPDTNMVTWVRTSVALFALLIAYIWVPVIKSRVSFNESFMATFKAFFNALLFSGVIFLGISLIIGAIDLLLFNVSEDAYIHLLNIIGMIFAPIYFLSLIPIYPGVSDKNRSQEQRQYNQEKIARSSACPKFLEILISYIIIPLVGIYTVILVIYIAINITGKFWTDNRLEPMLVGFAIVVILVCILVARFENKFAVLFRKIFPKIMVPIVLFQIVASVLSIQETGITHGRYYVILFGIFAGISGVLLSFIPVGKNGIIAALIIGFSLVSIVPPVDAFTISRINQEKRLTTVLIENEMLKDNEVIASTSVSKEDRKAISGTVNYLGRMDYTESINYLGEDFDLYEDFYDTFGFYRYEEGSYKQESLYLNLDREFPIDISGYDNFVIVSFDDVPEDQFEPEVWTLDKSGKTYTLSKKQTPKPGRLSLKEEAGQELMVINMQAVFDTFDILSEEEYQILRDSVPADQVTFTQENDQAKISLVAAYLSIDKSDLEPMYTGDFYVLIKIK
jgi:hypothetical protein